MFRKLFEMFCDDVGHVSALRIIVIPGAIVGMLLAASGGIAMFYNLSHAGTAMSVGAGMVATAQGAKAFQKQAEVRAQTSVDKNTTSR